MTHGPLAKICGLTRREDAVMAAAAGARFGGVILAPGGKRSVTVASAARMFEGLSLRRVGVFVDAPVEEVRRAAEAADLDVLQLHGSETPELIEELRADGRWAVWKAVRPRDGAELARAIDRYAGSVDGLLLDGWSAAAPGGTGSRFPWAAAAEHRSMIPATVALIVAGGLDGSNVGEAVSLLRPDVVDVSSGVESAPGVKDPSAVADFVAAARGAATYSHDRPDE